MPCRTSALDGPPITLGKPGWIALLFPQIPLGTGGANEIGGRYVYPGTYAIRSTTLRAIYMDLAVELGEHGFKWIFVVHGHGAPNHNRVLDEAGDFFNDTFGGQMIHLTGLILSPAGAEVSSPVDRLPSDGSPHAGVAETSTMLFLNPELVKPGVASSQTLSAPDWETRRQMAASRQWPGYFGTPRDATAAYGAQRLQDRTESLIDVALQILDGRDASQLQRRGDLGTTNPGNVPINEGALERESQVERMQHEWLEERTER